MVYIQPHSNPIAKELAATNIQAHYSPHLGILAFVPYFIAMRK